MKNILAENMLRFGTKNLKVIDTQRIGILSEQLDQTQKTENANASFNQGILATKAGQCIYSTIQLPSKPDTYQTKIYSYFYNNMVSSRGIMDKKRAEVDASISEFVTYLVNQEYTDITITIEGSATSRPPGDAPDNRFTGNIPLSLDHNRGKSGGMIYGGISPKNEPVQANTWLARERAKTLAQAIQTEAAKQGLIIKEIITTGVVIPGGLLDDEKRHANVKVNGIKPIYERAELGSPYLSFRVDYTTKEFESNASAITKKSADTDAPANIIAPDNQTGWKGNIIIEFGTRDNIPLLGKNIPAMRGLYHWKNMTERISVQQQGEWSPMTAGLTGAYGEDAKKPGSADLFNFLRSCGRFTAEQVNDIFANIKDVKESKLLNLARATPGTPIGGDLNKFAELYGGAAEFDGNLTKGGWDLDPNTMILTQKSGN